MAVSQGRALALATAWIAVPLTLAGLIVSLATYRPDDEWSGLGAALTLAAVLYLTPIGVLGAAITIARRSDRAHSAATLGTRAGLTGLAIALLAGAAYFLTTLG
jgi:hypothetical protein